MSYETIEAYGVNSVLGVEAIDGLVVIELAMQGGETLRIAMQPKTSWDLRPRLRDGERAAVAQKDDRSPTPIRVL